MTVAKIVDDFRDDLPHLFFGKLANTLEKMARVILASRKEGPRDDPAVLTDKPDRQTLDGKRRVLDHRSMASKQGVVAFGLNERGRLATTEKPTSDCTLMEDELGNHIGGDTTSITLDSSAAD